MQKEVKTRREGCLNSGGLGWSAATCPVSRAKLLSLLYGASVSWSVKWARPGFFPAFPYPSIRNRIFVCQFSKPDFLWNEILYFLMKGNEKKEDKERSGWILVLREQSIFDKRGGQKRTGLSNWDGEKWDQNRVSIKSFHFVYIITDLLFI